VDSGEILQRIEEIETRVAGAIPGPWRVVLNQEEDLYEIRTDGPGATVHIATLIRANWHTADFIACTREDVPWLCETVRQLVARLEKLEAVAKAARELLEFLPDSMNGEDWEWAWNQLYADSQERVKEVRERARKALAGLEKGRE